MSENQTALDARLFTAIAEKDVMAAIAALDAGADANAKDESGKYALYQAVHKRHVPITRLLAAHGAELDAINPDGKAALHLAASIGHPELCATLVDYGADTELEGESIIGSATAQAIAEDGVGSNAGLGENREAADVLRTYAEAAEMPLPDNADRSTLLFEAEGYVAPLDQPRFWQQGEAAMQQVASLTKDDWLQVNAAGKSWLQRGVECGAAKPLMAQLSQQNIHLTPQDLLLDDGTTSPLLATFCDHHAASTLFSKENWKGQGSEAMSKVYHALPQAAQAQVKNYQSLRVGLQQDERGATTQRGR